MERNRSAGPNQAHIEAINRLGFVNRNLPTGDPRNGHHFVPRSDFGQAIPALLVVIEGEVTTLEGWDSQTSEPWQATFDGNAPANILNQAVAAAMQEVGR